MHRSGRAGWLRAAVLGSDDAIVSTASLMIGVAASSASREAILIAGVAGLVAGAMSMAVGEYVSVSSQRDAEKADVEREKRELAGEPQAELQELATIYVKRGLEKDLAMKVAEQLSARPGIPLAPDAGGVDIRRKFCALCGDTDCGSSLLAGAPAYPFDRGALSCEPCGSWGVRRLSRRRADDACIAARHTRRRPGDGSDCTDRPDSRRRCGVVRFSKTPEYCISPSSPLLPPAPPFPWPPFGGSNSPVSASAAGQIDIKADIMLYWIQDAAA